MQRLAVGERFSRFHRNPPLVTDSAFSNKRYTYLFEEAGCIIVGHQMFVRHEKRSTGIENVDATGILVVIDGESVKAVDSDD